MQTSTTNASRYIVSLRLSSSKPRQAKPDSTAGHTLYVKVTLYPDHGGKPALEESAAEPAGQPLAGRNQAPGSWRTEEMKLPDNALVSTCKETTSELSVSDATGTSWTAKFDGEDYPIRGSSVPESVALKKINDQTIEMTIKANGTILSIHTMTMSGDAKTMTTVFENELTGRTATWVATEQEK